MNSMSFFLRHDPEELGTILDPEGFVPLNVVVDALSKRWDWVTEEDVREVVETCDKGRFEIIEGDIRACYGHSTGTRIEYEPIEPPALLYHGTARRFLDDINRDGLKPMSRQYVHLTVSKDIARMVGRRRDRDPVVLEVAATEAYTEGILFYRANDNFWLADRIPPGHIRVP